MRFVNATKLVDMPIGRLRVAEYCNENDNLIADNVEKISTYDISIGPEDDELTTPGPSRPAKRTAKFWNSARGLGLLGIPR